MENTRKNKILKTAATTLLAVCLIGGVVALGGCSGNKKEYINDYTPMRGDGKTYYVASDVPQFTSSQHDGSFDDPYNILDLVGYGSSGSHSNSSILEPGDTVLVKPGQYVQTTSVYVVSSGTYDNYITIMNAAYADDGHTYDSTTCTISLYGETFEGNNRGVTINSDYIYWYGIDVAGAGDNGMYIGGNHNVIENCQFYNNRDTGFQLGRKQSADTDIKDWPSYNLIKNCTSFNNYDNETYGENADGFGAKLTIGYGNIFDGCIAYRNSDDGWDLYAKDDTGNIGCVIIYNCIAFENGYLMETQETCNARFPTFSKANYGEDNTNSYTTRDGDGNGFKLGGGSNEGDVKLYNCMSFNNRMHGVTDNSNPGTLQIESVTSYNNGASINNNSTSETFGQVYYDGGTEDDGCANIDLSRWTYSYNTFANVLSVIDGNSKTAGDAYRGATTNSMFLSSGSSGYYVGETVDADNKTGNGVVGTKYTPASASAVFEATPAFDLGTRTTIDANGVVVGGTGCIHSELRMEDGTINAGSMLKIKDNADLVLTDVGCDLSKGSWDEYTHYEYSVGCNEKNSTNERLTTISNMIYIPVYEDAVYQNFKVVNSIWGVKIDWASSDTSVLSVSKNAIYTTSQSSTVAIKVNRDKDEDKHVTLTAQFEVDGKIGQKNYELTIKKDTPSIGDVIVDGVEYGQAIVDQYAAFPEPAVTVGNGSDYNGKILTEDLYTIKKTYEYAETAAGTFDEIGTFTTSNAGVYRITLDISIDNPDANAPVTQKTYTYLIYVASKDASVTFMDDEMTLTVNRDGYEISGDLSSPTGYSYVLKSNEPLSGTGTDGVIVAEDVTGGEAVIREEFRTTTLTLDYTDDNDSGYYVYCVLTSLDGTQTSPVYTAQASVKEISSTSDFDDMLESSNSSTIYLLKNDIDYGTTSGETGEDENSVENVVGGDTGHTEGNNTVSAVGTFKGLLNGLGHTVKNISTTKRAIFDTVDNGTIENIKFENIEINYSGASSSGTSTSAGLIGLMKGGYLYNIAATNITVISNGQRVGGIVGDINVSSGGNERSTYIDGVSLVNEYTHAAYTMDATGAITENYTGAIIKGVERIGGIVGFIQAGGTDSWNKVYISNCFVDAYITASSGIAAGMVGRSDDRNANDYLEISECFIYGVIESTSNSKSYLGGVTGQFTGTGETYIHNCMSYCELWYGNESIKTSLKNASWIIGNFAANGNIRVVRCYAYADEYNEEYGVNSSNLVLADYSSWVTYCPFDMESGYWKFVTDGDTENPKIEVPYLELIFQGEWNLENED